MAKKKRKARGPAGDAIAMDSPYSARYDLETLQRAHEIAQDGKRFGAAKSEAKRQKEALERIGRLEGKKL